MRVFVPFERVDRFCQGFRALGLKAQAPALENQHAGPHDRPLAGRGAVVAGLVEAGQGDAFPAPQGRDGGQSQIDVVCARNAARGKQRVDLPGHGLPLGPCPVEIVERENGAGDRARGQSCSQGAGEGRLAAALRAANAQHEKAVFPAGFWPGPAEQGVKVAFCGEQDRRGR